MSPEQHPEDSGKFAASSPADEFREIAGGFGDRVHGVAGDGWGRQSPVPEWTARDVVRHLVEWLPPFLGSGSRARLPVVTPVDVDPVAAWDEHAAAVQALLDDQEVAGSTFSHPYLATMPLGQAVSQFYTADVFMHTWDLARATGGDERLDQHRCRRMYEGMLGMDEMLRAGGQYGPRVPVAADADPQTLLLAFIGRTP